MAKNNERNPQTAQIDLGSSSADALLNGVYFPKKSKIISVKLFNEADLAASDTNFFVGQLKNGSTVVAAVDTRAGGQGAIVSGVAKDLVIVDAQSTVPKDTWLKFNYDETDAGTNVALTKAKLVVTFFPL